MQHRQTPSVVCTIWAGLLGLAAVDSYLIQSSQHPAKWAHPLVSSTQTDPSCWRVLPGKWQHLDSNRVGGQNVLYPGTPWAEGVSEMICKVQYANVEPSFYYCLYGSTASTRRQWKPSVVRLLPGGGGLPLTRQRRFVLFSIWATQHFDLNFSVDNKWIFIVFMSIVLYKTSLGEREGINIWDSKHLNASS